MADAAAAPTDGTDVTASTGAPAAETAEAANGIVVVVGVFEPGDIVDLVGRAVGEVRAGFGETFGRRVVDEQGQVGFEGLTPGDLFFATGYSNGRFTEQPCVAQDPADAITLFQPPVQPSPTMQGTASIEAPPTPAEAPPAELEVGLPDGVQSPILTPGVADELADEATAAGEDAAAPTVGEDAGASPDPAVPVDAPAPADPVAPVDAAAPDAAPVDPVAPADAAPEPATDGADAAAPLPAEDAAPVADQPPAIDSAPAGPEPVAADPAPATTEVPAAEATGVAAPIETAAVDAAPVAAATPDAAPVDAPAPDAVVATALQQLVAQAEGLGIEGAAGSADEAWLRTAISERNVTPVA